MGMKDSQGLPPSEGQQPSEHKEEEMLSPPWPLNEDTVDKLYQRILQLRCWFDRYRVASNNYTGKKDCVPSARKVPDLEGHRRLSLARLHGLVLQMRSLRQGWDFLVCRFEDHWESGKSQDERHALLHYGYLILDGAYLSDEMLEARNDTMQRQCMETLARETRRFILDLKIDPYHTREDHGDHDEEEPF